MSSDQPPRAKSRPVTLWIAQRVRRDQLIYRGFSILLWICAVIALFATFATVEAILWGLNLAFCGIGGRTFSFLMTIPTVAALFWANAQFKRDPTRKIVVERRDGDRTILRLSRLSGPAWLVIFDAPEEWPVFVRFCVNLILLAPRLFELARRTWKLSGQLAKLPFELLGQAVELLIKSGGKTPLVTILDDFPNQEPQAFIDQLLQLDGVVFLPHETPGLTVVPSLVDDFENWLKIRRQQAAS